MEKTRESMITMDEHEGRLSPSLSTSHLLGAF